MGNIKLMEDMLSAAYASLFESVGMTPDERRRQANRLSPLKYLKEYFHNSKTFRYVDEVYATDIKVEVGMYGYIDWVNASYYSGADADVAGDMCRVGRVDNVDRNVITFRYLDGDIRDVNFDKFNVHIIKSEVVVSKYTGQYIPKFVEEQLDEEEYARQSDDSHMSDAKLSSSELVDYIKAHPDPKLYKIFSSTYSGNHRSWKDFIGEQDTDLHMVTSNIHNSLFRVPWREKSQRRTDVYNSMNVVVDGHKYANTLTQPILDALLEINGRSKFEEPEAPSIRDTLRQASYLRTGGESYTSPSIVPGVRLVSSPGIKYD